MESYRVVFSGALDFENYTDKSPELFAKLFLIPEEKIALLFNGQSYVLAKNLGKEKALFIQNRLAEIGIVLTIQPENNTVAQEDFQKEETVSLPVSSLLKKEQVRFTSPIFNTLLKKIEDQSNLKSTEHLRSPQVLRTRPVFIILSTAIVLILLANIAERFGMMRLPESLSANLKLLPKAPNCSDERTIKLVKQLVHQDLWKSDWNMTAPVNINLSQIQTESSSIYWGNSNQYTDTQSQTIGYNCTAIVTMVAKNKMPVNRDIHYKSVLNGNTTSFHVELHQSFSATTLLFSN